jgi:hypothetical protein
MGGWPCIAGWSKGCDKIEGITGPTHPSTRARREAAAPVMSNIEDLLSGKSDDRCGSRREGQL